MLVTGNLGAETRTEHNDSNNFVINRSVNRKSVPCKTVRTTRSIETQSSTHSSRCQCTNMKEVRVAKKLHADWAVLGSTMLVIGLLLIQQAAQATALTLQHGVPGAGGRNAGDPAPGRSPGPPLLLDPSNFQRLAIPPDSARTMVRHRPEINVDDPNQNDDLPEDRETEMTRNYGRHQSSSTVGVSSPTHFREDVTQENTKPTLSEDEFSGPIQRFDGRAANSGHAPNDDGPENGYTMPISRQTDKDVEDLIDADDYTRSWHQGIVLDDLEEDQDHNMSEENPTIILTSDSDQSISLPSSGDFSSYEDNNDTDSSWCGGDMQADAKLATSVWLGLLNVTVVHPIFRTDRGLVRGITYQVGVSKRNAVEDIEDVFLMSEVDGRPCGRFISVWEEEVCPGAEWSVIGRLDGRTSVTFNWSTDVTSTEGNQRSNITFRLRFRTRSSKTTLQLQHSLPLLADCQLSLWPTRGNVSWRDFPRQTKDCQVFFPGSTAAETDRRGLVVELTRLNVPCPAGGFLQFSSSSHRGNSSTAQQPSPRTRATRSRHQQLCGKLEELPPSGRRLYFPAPSLSSSTSSITPSLRLHGNPIFAFTYRLVDYCYNVTLTSKNDTLILRPTAGLHCTFRIHLPYGNRVSLRLQTGDGHLLTTEDPGHRSSEHHSVPPSSNGQASHDSPLTQLGYGDHDPPCPGLLTRLWDGASTWTHCTKKGDPRRDIRVLSRENSVMLRVVIHQAPQDSHLDASHIPALRLWYHAEPVPDVVEQCTFGWVSMRQFCVSAVEDLRLPWHEAEVECSKRGGHLASIRSEQAQDLVDSLLLNSPGYRDHNSYWVGASDKTYEGDFRWSDGLPFSYTNWFPGWAQHNHYNRQPNDDGYSEQDCVELRRVYHLPSANERLTHSFMWNDRDCSTPNLFLCERLRTGITIKEVWPPECNRSVTLSREQPRATVVSPGFPHQYPDNAECDTEIIAPLGYRLVLDFEELVLEKEPYCSYDYLEIFEGMSGSNSSGVATRKLCGDWSSKLKLLRYVSRGPRIRLRFVSDYSHHYGGFKAKVSMENGMECADDRLQMFNSSCYLFVSYPEVTWQTAQQICRGMKAELASIHSPEEENFVTANIRDSTEYSTSAIYWLGGQLVAKSIDHWEWVDGSPLTFSGNVVTPRAVKDHYHTKKLINCTVSYILQKNCSEFWCLEMVHPWLPGHTPADAEVSDSSSYSLMCLGIQWMPSPTPALPSGLYWQSQRCNAVGGYVCKRGNQVSGSGLQLNRTINGSEGFLTSPNFPGNYYHNLDYWVQLVGPERTRLVIQFKQLDLESQTECLYDYVELRSIGRENQLLHDDVRWCGSHHSEMDRFNFVTDDNKAVLRFHSDYSVAGAGFSATWQAVDISGCPLQTLTAREGTLVSPNYPHFLMAHLECATTILAPTGRRIWLEFVDFDLGSQHQNGRDLQLGDKGFSQAMLEVDLSGGNRPFQPFQVPGHLTDGAYLSEGERLYIRLRTADKPRGIGFKAVYRTLAQAHEERLIDLTNVTVGTLLHLNYPKPAPPHVEFLQHLVAPEGHVILLELYHMMLSESRNCPDGAGIIEVTDNYADTNGTWWFLCQAMSESGGRQGSSTLAITSYFNTLYLKQKSGTTGVQLNATVKVYRDTSYRIKLVRGSEESSVESCYPNPCLNGGKCVSRGSHKLCQCTSHFTGMFCALTLCETQPCAFGQCKLTPTSYACTCLPSYTGSNCEQKLRPCADNPCEGRGECFERGDSFHCRCHAWWEGQRCERRMLHIPFKPLSERMLQEPFWLGLITVTVVLGVIGLVWCAKRHFPEKLEKLLAEEADRSRAGTSSHSRPPSVREQLATAGGATVVVVPSPQPGCPRSLFGRLGIRKPSLLSLTSPHGHNNHPTAASATARTFSLDDLLKPPPRRTPSPRKKRNNSTPTKKNIAEKKQILQQLITPSNQQHPRKVSLGELIQLSERKLKEADKAKEGAAEGEETETTFSTAMSDSQSAPSTAAMSSIDAKFEKKVTFARLLSKVSAEMSSGSEVEANQIRHSQLSGLPRSNSTPPSPAADTRSPHSTSSNQGSDSMSSLDASIPLGGGGQTVTELLANRRPNRLLQQGGRPIKNPSADSILAMFRNFSSATSGPSAHKISPSTTPTASSPQDDAAGSDESSTSSVPTPISSSSFTLDSPPLPHAFHRHNHSNTIEVPVLDALSAHKTVCGGSNLLQPPTILLEIPCGGISKCLSPIREVPTPLATPSPSPALTPIMPRSAPPYLRSSDDQIITVETDSLACDSDLQLPCITITNSDDDENEEEEKVLAREVTYEVSKCESNPISSSAPGQHEESKAIKAIQIPLPFKMRVRPPNIGNSLGPMLLIDDNDGPAGKEKGEVCTGGEAGCCENETNVLQPVIPMLTIQQPSPTHRGPPPVQHPGSPPPHRGGMNGGHAELSFPFPGKGPRRLLKELDKPNSLDLPCPPPLITVTCNMSEAESDTESISPAAKTGGPHPGVSGGSVGMCYLSPFSMCSRADRTASESNLSSSGYSSMASPGPSRCGSNNPLCPSEVEDPPGPGLGCGPTTLPGHGLIQRKPSPLLRTPATTTCPSECEGEAERPPEDRGLQGGHCRGRSDSETLSDDLFVESNDEGIGTDHLDEKIEEGELKSAKELEVFIGKELLENGKTLLGLPILSAPPVTTTRAMTKCGSVDTGLDCCKLLPPTAAPSSKSSLQLPAIVVQTDPSGCEKHLSPVSSRSESPLSDKTAGLGRFSPLFYGRHKSDQLPFTDSDGLYDCPSSDCPLNRVQGSTTAQQHRKSTGRRRERRSAPRGGGGGGGGGNKTPSPTKVTTFLDVPGKEQFYRPTVPRKPSPKRSRTRTQPRVSSSSSSESLNSTRELTVRTSSEKTINPDRVSWPGAIVGQKEVNWGNDSKGHLSIEASGEDTGEEVTSHMLPKIMAREDVPKPHRKVSRLRTIGHQIRFLRRLELSLKRRERLVSPSDSVESCGEEEDDGEGSPPSLSPLLSHHQYQQELHKSSSFGHLQQAASRGGRGRQRGPTTKQKRASGVELLLPSEDRAWRHIHVTGGSGHTD